MSHELIYLLLICGLLVAPRALQRFRMPAPLSCFLVGIALVCTAARSTTTRCICWRR